jgi:hypothetical protein
MGIVASVEVDAVTGTPGGVGEWPAAGITWREAGWKHSEPIQRQTHAFIRQA